MISNLGIEYRLLWAEAIDRDRTALVIQYGSQLIGGVAKLHAFEMTAWGAHFGSRPTTLDLKFLFEWFEVVADVDAFRRSKAWRYRTPFNVQQPPLAQLPRKEFRCADGVIRHDAICPPQLWSGDAEVLRIATSPEAQTERKFYGPGCDDTGTVNYDLPARGIDAGKPPPGLRNWDCRVDWHSDPDNSGLCIYCAQDLSEAGPHPDDKEK